MRFLRLLRLWLTLVSFTMLFVACQQVEFSRSTSSSSASHNHTSVIASGTGINPDGIWPPQPANMTQTNGLSANAFQNQALQSQALQNQSISVRKVSIQEAILSDRALRAALGTNYLVLDVNFSEQKDGSTLQEVILFSYSNNHTVRAWLTAGFARQHSVAFEVIAASDYQFPESKNEIDEAISLARAALLTQGYADAQTLNAHAMLTYPDEQSTEKFYNVRMLYVTLGAGNGAVPMYAAWVDLSNNVVTKSGLVGSY